MRQYISELMPLIVEALLDGAAVTKREVAVSTLGQVVQSTGYVAFAFCLFKFYTLLDYYILLWAMFFYDTDQNSDCLFNEANILESVFVTWFWYLTIHVEQNVFSNFA